jgi:metallo-beta-lactamase class B
MVRGVSLAAVFLCASGVWAQYAPPMTEWNRPVEPFRVVGNVYYVGASNVSSILIATPAGNILLETGFRETVPLIEANVKKLGFRFDDIRLLLSSHAHFDHSGGLAEVKARTKARLLVSSREAGLFSRGGKGDPNLGDKYPFPPVTPDGLLHDGEEIELGGTVLTAHFTPGHTPGCVTYTTTVREGPKAYHVVFPCSLTAPGYRLVNNPACPDIVADFESTFAKLAALPCDIFLPHHRPAGEIRERAGKPDAEGYRRWLSESRAAFHKQLEEQKAWTNSNSPRTF